jgi:hypothetical protein
VSGHATIDVQCLVSLPSDDNQGFVCPPLFTFRTFPEWVNKVPNVGKCVGKGVLETLVKFMFICSEYRLAVSALAYRNPTVANRFVDSSYLSYRL